MTLLPEAIAAAAVAALLLGIAMASGRHRGKGSTRRCSTQAWRASAAHGIAEVQERLGRGSYTTRRGAPRPVITERQAREHYAMGEQFSSDATPEIRRWLERPLKP